jgi:hypothetical protein
VHPGPSERRGVHVEAVPAAGAVVHGGALLPVELQLLAGRRLEPGVRVRRAAAPDGYAAPPSGSS